MEELQDEIEISDPGPEREELERTLQACREMVYAVEEGFVCIEEDEDEEIRFFPEAECYHAEPIEAIKA